MKSITSSTRGMAVFKLSCNGEHHHKGVTFWFLVGISSRKHSILLSIPDDYSTIVFAVIINSVIHSEQESCKSKFADIF